MAVLFADNFSQYGTTETYMLDGIWAEASASLFADPDGVSSGYVIRTTDSATQWTRKVLTGGSIATVGVAFRVWFDSLPQGNVNSPAIMRFSDTGNGTQISVYCNPSGYLLVYRGESPGGALLGQSSVPVITAGAWAHVEIKVFIHDSTGTVEVRVNEVVKINLTAQDTKATSNAEVTNIIWDNYGLSDTTVAETFYIKDLVIWDTNGSQNNDFIGDCRVITLLPDTDVSLNWSCSTGTDGGNLIDETDPNDADYIYAASPPPSAFVSELTNLPVDVTTVKALLPFVRMLKTDGGTAAVQTSLVSSAVDDNGADNAITVAATTYYDVSELDPNTGTAWTPTTTNAARLKINRTA